MIPSPYKHYKQGSAEPTQVLATGAASVASAAFGPQTYAIRVIATAACHIAFGAAPVATANDAYVAPSVRPEFIGVTPGSKIAAIEDTAAGKLYITELSR
jgi:hypothetical protein